MKPLNAEIPSSLPRISENDLQSIIQDLPKIPTAIRYYDDFLEEYHSIRELVTNDKWTVVCDGRTVSISFKDFGYIHGYLLKHVFVVLFSKNSPSTIILHYTNLCRSLHKFGLSLFDCLIGLKPHEVREIWMKKIFPVVNRDDAAALRTVLHAYCKLNVGPWHPGFHDYVSELPSPRRDIYKTVRTGDCFVPVDQQSKLIDYFDELAAHVSAAPEEVDTNTLRDAGVLLFIYQHAFRRGQVARIKTEDIRIFNTGVVHFSTPLTKKKNMQQRRRVSRRVKHEWCPIIIEFSRRRSFENSLSVGVPSDSFFGLGPREVTTLIKTLTKQIMNEEWSAMDLRHSAAQRLADAGSAHIALSEFMGHSSTKTATVYYDASPSQAQRINQALGLSPIFSAVAEVARTQTIDKEALLNLPADKQIGAAPHGIPIAGIGACSAGQSLCIKNVTVRSGPPSNFGQDQVNFRRYVRRY